MTKVPLGVKHIDLSAALSMDGFHITSRFTITTRHANKENDSHAACGHEK